MQANPTRAWCEELEYSQSTQTTECKPVIKFYEGGEISNLLRKSIFDDSQKTSYEYANSWEIDPDYIKNEYPNYYYIQNPDGSIDIELELYYKPQSYFYIGLLISGITLFICIAYLLYSWRSKPKRKPIHPTS